MRLAITAFLSVLLHPALVSLADDWPQWLGPHRDATWREDDIVDRFPQAGLEVKWRVPIGYGYAGPAVADGKVFVMDYKKTSGEISNNPGGRTELAGSERIVCLDAQTGRELWTHDYEQPYNISYAAGPRCTPAIDAGKVFSLGAEGSLRCVDSSNGELIWSKQLTNEYEVETPHWGFASHPLVDGDFLYCVVGGKGSVAVALDKNTGEEVWRALSADEPGYCPPAMIEHGGVKQLLIWHIDAINSLNPQTGEVYWSVPLVAAFGLPVAAPRLLGDELFASAIGNVGALYQLDGTAKPRVLWRGKAKTAVYCCNSTPFMEGGTIYGSDCETGALIAVNLADGTRLWQTVTPTSGARGKRHGTAFLVKQKDRFFLFTETGDLILAKLSPSGYEELGRFHVLEPTNTAFGRNVVWSHPAFAQRSMFARNDKEIVCVNLAAD